MMLIGSMEPVPLDFAVIAERFQTPGIAQALEEVGVLTPADLLATYVTDRSGLEAYGGQCAASDRRPPTHRVRELGAGTRASQGFCPSYSTFVSRRRS